MKIIHLGGSRGNFGWFAPSAGFSNPRASLAASANLLSSVTVFEKARLLTLIIFKNHEMSRLAYPAIVNDVKAGELVGLHSEGDLGSMGHDIG